MPFSHPSPTRTIIGAVVLACALGANAWAAEVHTDFSEGFGPWVPLHTGKWEIQDAAGTPVAALIEEGTQRPPVRRPTAYLFLEDHVWQDVEFTVLAKSLEPDSVTNRDVILIFGYQDDTHYYYTHVCSSTDGTTHNIIMKVAGDQRTTIHRETLPEPRLTNDRWHTIRVRHLSTGAIQVFVDDLEEALMTARDSAYPAGSVAFGAFDDRAVFNEVTVDGTQVEFEPAEPAFSGGIGEPVSISYFGAAGLSYRIETSTNLRTWMPVGESITGQGALVTEEVQVSSTVPSYLRLSGSTPALATE